MKTKIVNYRNRILAALLAVVVLVAVVLSPAVTVYADSEPQWIELKNEYTVAQAVHEYLIAMICGIYPGNPVEFYNNRKAEYDEWWSDVYDRNKNEHGGGSISFDDVEINADEMTKFKEITDSNLTELNGYYLVENCGMTVPEYVYSLSSLSSDIINSALDWYNNETVSNVIYFGTGANSPTIMNCRMPVALYLEDGLVWRITSEYTKSKSYGYWTALSSDKTLYPSYLSFYLSSQPLKCFYTYADYLKWKNAGKSNIYVSNQYVNYQPKVITINPTQVSQVVNNNTVQKVYNESVTNITESGGESGLTQDQVQDIVDQAVEKVISAMPTPEPTVTPAPTGTPGGGSSGGSGSDSGNYSGILQQIYDQLVSGFDKVSSGIEDTIAAIKDIKTGGGNGFVGSLLGSSIGGLVDDIVDKVLDGKETAEDAAESIISSFTPLVEASKTKFPICLPWDLVAIFRVLSADPETPVFKIPFNVDSINYHYELVLDLKDFDTLSKLSRAFLALTFLVVLMKFTLELVEGGFFDD